jgi:hypothetical protein
MSLRSLALAAISLSLSTTSCSREAKPGGSGLATETRATPVSSAMPDATPAASPQACEGFGSPQDMGALQDRALHEASGLVVSRRNKGVLFSHNDSGDTARIFAMTRTGHPLGTYRVQGANAIDWEEMTQGPAPGRDGSYLYIADMGDNLRVRPFAVIYRFPEPLVSATQAPATFDIANVETFELHYPDHPHDAETLLVDPVSGSLVVVTKEREGPSIIFTAPPLTTPNAPVALTKVGTLTFGRAFISGRLATSGHVTPNGNAVVVRTYSDAWLYTRAPGTKLWDALLTTPCALPLALEPQGESFAFTETGDGYFTVSEGEGAILHYVARTSVPAATVSP